MSRGASIVIVGAGVIGLSTAYALSERGVDDIVVVDRDTVGSGGTSRSSGIVRCHYGVPSLAAMAWKSVPTLVRAKEVLGEDTGYLNTGYLVGVGAENVDALKANVAMQAELGIKVEIIGHEDVREMWPEMHLEDFAAFAYEPLGGYADGYLTANAFGLAARRRGVRILPQSPVAGIRDQGGRVGGVRMSDGREIDADVVVIAAGSWSTRLAATVGVELPVEAQHADLLVVDPGVAERGRRPVLSDLVSLQYLRLEGPTGLLVGNSDHSHPTRTDDEDTFVAVPDEQKLFDSIAKFGHRFPGYDNPGLRSTYSGFYDVTPDYNPVIDEAPIEGLFLLAGFSGHGFKISPAVGRLAAELILDGHSLDPLVPESDFRLERFDQDDLLLSLNPYLGAGEMR